MELEVNLNSFCLFEGFLGLGKTVDVHQNKLFNRFGRINDKCAHIQIDRVERNNRSRSPACK